MDFIYKNVSALNKFALSQGDVIARTDEVVERIGQAHQYYADAHHYTHFVVLTQSCDLVKRRNQFNAPYITIAAAKPFKKTIDDFFDGKSKSVEGAEFTYYSLSLMKRVKQLVERHINNTEPEFFFLPSSGHPNIPEDLVVFLRLTIALRKEHYDTFAQAKIAELADIFQAKIGWLKGNIYSRVATPDIEERNINAAAIKKGFYDRHVPKGDFFWLSDLQSKFLKGIVNERRQDIGRDLTRDEVLEIIEKEIPEDTQIIAANIVERLKKNKLIDTGDEDAAKKFARVIANEPSFKSLVKSSDD